MEIFITVIHLISIFFLILAVLLQTGNSGGMGAAFGGGNSAGVFGATGATSLLGKITYVMAALFMITSLWLSILQGNSGDTGLEEQLKQRATSSETAPTEMTPPAISDDTAAPETSSETAAPSEGSE